MPALARGQASDCANPEIDLFTAVNGALVDVDTAEFIIFEKVSTPGVPTQIYPATPGVRQTIDVATLCPTGDKVSTGRFVAKYTPGLTDPVGTYEVQWFFKLTATSPEQTYKEEFEVLAEVVGFGSDGYCTVGSLRDEGVTETLISDAALVAKIVRASALLDRFTGRHFKPESKIIRLDGRGSQEILLNEPIIAINTVTIESELAIDNAALDLADLRIYNRHLSQNLAHPDDRENPKIAFSIGRHPYDHGQHNHYPMNFHHYFWPVGTQNIVIDGVFGYTDPDGSSTGKTPDLICRACELLVMRDLYSLMETDKREDAQKRWRLTRERTRDQEYQLLGMQGDNNNRAAFVGSFTGDPAVDSIISMFRRPAMFGSA